MWPAFLFDPVFFGAVLVFVLVMAYFYWVQNRKKEKALEARLKRLEEQVRKEKNESKQIPEKGERLQDT